MSKNGLMALAIAFSLTGCGSVERSRSGGATLPQTEKENVMNPADVRSDVLSMDYLYQGFYFSSPARKIQASDFVFELNKCIVFHTKATADNGAGVQVLRSFGMSDEKITKDGVMLCMAVKEWVFYKKVDGEMRRVNRLGLRYDAMSESQIKSEDDLIIAQKKWYERYAPEVL